MSIYEGTPTEQNYAHGRDEGYAFGEHDLAEGLGVAVQEAYYRSQGARDVHGTNNRAWYLGLARGYREAVRTLKNGRWGT